MPNPYETQKYLHEYLLFHYGRASDLCPFDLVPRDFLRFHERIRKECLLPIRKGAKTRALDIGCAVGRFTFELSRVVDEVIGIDNSKQFINVARQIARNGTIVAQAHESGAEITTRKLSLPKPFRRNHVHFEVGDAAELSSFAGQRFDIVATINVICRLRQPTRFLRQLEQLVTPGGQLILGSPFSWLKEHTSSRQWLTPSDVEDLLRPAFRLVRSRELPFLIREHRRKYQLVISRIMTFRRLNSSSSS